MITPMKKVTLLCLESQRESTLEVLRELGVLHLMPLRPPTGESLDALRQELNRLQSSLDLLPPPAKGSSPQGGSAADAAALVQTLQGLAQERQSAQEQLQDLAAELERLSPFGTVDPATVANLVTQGVGVQLLRCDAQRFAELYPVVQKQHPQAVLRPCGESRGQAHLILLSQPPVEVPEGFSAVALPEQPTRVLAERQGQLRHRLREIESELQVLAPRRGQLLMAMAAARESLELANARAGMVEHGGLCAIRGYCPEPRMAALQQEAQRQSWGLRSEDPSAMEAVPTLLQQPPWVKPINTLFGMIGIMPGYREIDISAVFLLFFTLFFGMLVGDAGYGLIFLGITLWARKKFPEAPGQIFAFAGTMSGITILWGILTATWFGITPELLPRAFTQGQITWLRDARNLQHLCFLIGTIHLTIAHLWNIWLMRRSLQALAQVGWLATTWTMFFLANQLVLGEPFPSYMSKVFVGGVALIFFFNVPVKKLKEEWFNLVMLPLNLVSNFVDVVSYIRLFAVGSATFAVANSFNNMLAPMLGGWAAPIAALLLFMGHGLNITLAVMGVLVHGVRLNTLEFSNHIGLQWTGEAYAPLAKQSSKN